MIYDTLPYKEGMELKSKLRMANMVAVTVRYSTDGHFHETLWIEYDNKGNALYMLELILHHSKEVVSYSVYDDQGEVVKSPNQESFPKRH